MEYWWGKQIKDEECGEYGTNDRREIHTELCWGKLQLRDCLTDLGVDGRKMTTATTMITWILKDTMVKHGLDLSASGQRQVAGSSENGNALGFPSMGEIS
jgi:hypothetical protein